MNKITYMARHLAHEVAPIYQFLGWRWVDTGVPTEEDIAATLIGLYEDAANSEGNFVESGTGGLHVERFRDEEGNTQYSFSFRVEIETRMFPPCPCCKK